MIHRVENLRNTADVIIIGGGAVGLHTAHTLYDAMGKRARILVVTQESEWGGLAGRSLEQYRSPFNDSYALAEIVDRGMKLYERVDEELQERNKGNRASERAYEQFPYIFTVGAKKRPDYIEELLPPGTPDRADMTYYRGIKRDMEAWGFNPQAQEISPEELQQRFPLLDGQNIESAMIVDNAGRLHFDVMKSWMMERSRADGNGRGVTYRARTALRRILTNNYGKAIGVDLGGEKVYSDKIVLAIGAFVINLPQLLPGEESERLAADFTVTQRELFFSHMPGVRQDTNFFLISPDMAVARISTREGHATYGYAATDDSVILNPTTNPRPDETFDPTMQINHKSLFVARTYAMLGECSRRWDPDYRNSEKPNLAIEPFGYSAGSYTTYRDGLPVVGQIGDTGVILAAGSGHSGIMGGQGIAELTVDHALGRNTFSDTTRKQTDINRVPLEHTGLVL